MKLQHYLAGLESPGPVNTETRVFVEPWETRIFGIHMAMMALSSQLPLEKTPSTFNTIWTWASLRTGAEGMNPFEYFKYRYYEKWLGGISSYFISEGYITEAELDALTEEYLANPEKPLPEFDETQIDARVHQYMVEGDSPLQSTSVEYDFAEGDTVVIGNPPTVDHTKLPGCLRNKTGVIEIVYEGAYNYLCEIPEEGVGPAMPIYCVAFQPEELWPGNAEKNFTFYADLYAVFLDSASAASAAA